MLTDSYGRIIRDLRVSLTDRCNFRCFYCLPNGEPPLARKETILTFEEIAEICEIFVSLGIEKIRLTGGEPLLRKDIESLIEKLARLKAPSSDFQVPSENESEISDYKLQITKETDYKLQITEEADCELQTTKENDSFNKISDSVITDYKTYDNQSEICNSQSEIDSEICNLKFEIDEARSPKPEVQSPEDNNRKSQIANRKLKDLALTTNGFSLEKRAENLKKAGLDRVTISLDSLKRENFQKITGVDKLDEVLQAIEAAKRARLNPVRINAVVVRGWNDDEVVDLANFARENAISMRFIEYMPLDSAHEWDRKLVVSGREIFKQINARFPLRLKKASRGSETAWKYSFKDSSKGEIGIIAPVTEMFCGACSRIRLTADGQIRTCLFSTKEHNLRDFLRSGASRDEIVEFIREVVFQKEPRHFINDAQFAPASRSMSFIGG